MLSQCPVCRARLDRAEPPPPLEEPCHRCGSDLSLVRATHLHAERHQADARAALRDGDVHEAVRAAHRAVQLVDEPTTRATLASALWASRQGGVDPAQD